MKQVGFSLHVLAVGLLCVSPAMAGAQGDSQPAPEKWREMSLEEFVSEIVRLTAGKQTLSAEVWKELHSQSLGRLRGALDGGGKADYFDLIRLYMWARDTLTQEQKDSLLKQLGPPLDKVPGWTFDKLQATIDWMGWAGTPKDYRDTLLAAWLKDRKIDSVVRDTSENRQFAWLCREVLLAEAQLPKETLEAVRSQAAQQVCSLAADAAVSYDDLLAMYLAARGQLATEEHAPVFARLNAQAAEVAGWGYWQMRHRFDQMAAAGIPRETRETLLWAWLKDRNIESLAPIDDVAWLVEKAYLAGPDEPARPQFSAQWTGFVRAPADGVYTFSLCPLDLDVQAPTLYRRQTTGVWIAGRQVLDSKGVSQAPSPPAPDHFVVPAASGARGDTKQNGWTFRSEPVELKAGQKTPIRVELSYACSGQDVIEDRPAVAILMWEGPEMEQRVVPPSALWPPEGEGNGLQAEYRLPVGGQQKTFTRVDPNLYYVWYRTGCLIPSHPELQARLGDRLWALVTDRGTLAKWELTDAARSESWLVTAWWFPRWLPASRHRPLAAELLSRPGLMEGISLRRARELYRHCRIGAPDQAIELLGKWAQMHPDIEPVFSQDYYVDNREFPRDLCRKMFWECRPHYDALEARYLVLPDGRCCLLTAYMLCYGYWEQKRIGEWIDKLDARLRDKGLAGDRRVNWLLARAQAEELRYSPPGRHWYTIDRSLAGVDWLQEACSAAESEPVRLRAYKELAARLAADQQPEAAREILAAAAARCSQAASTEQLADWRKQIDTLAKQYEKTQQEHEAAAQRAYVEALRRRHKRAVERGDQEAISHYEEVLTAAGADSGP